MRTKINGKIYITCLECKGNGTKPCTVLGVPLKGIRDKCEVCGGRGKVEEVTK